VSGQPSRRAGSLGRATGCFPGRRSAESRPAGREEGGHMAVYVGQRLVTLVPILLGVSLLVFGLMRLIPGAPVRVLLGMEVGADAIDQARHEYGLDQPLPVQYLAWLGRAVRGDFGTSLITHQRVGETILQKLPATVE